MALRGEVGALLPPSSKTNQEFLEVSHGICEKEAKMLNTEVFQRWVLIEKKACILLTLEFHDIGPNSHLPLRVPST